MNWGIYIYTYNYVMLTFFISVQNVECEGWYDSASHTFNDDKTSVGVWWVGALRAYILVSILKSFVPDNYNKHTAKRLLVLHTF